MNEPFISVPHTVLVGPSAQPATNISDLFVEDSVVDPWRQLGTSRVAALVEPRAGLRLLTVHVVSPGDSLRTFVQKAIGGPRHQPAPHSVALAFQDNNHLVARVFSICMLKKVDMHGDGENDLMALSWEVGSYRTIG